MSFAGLPASLVSCWRAKREATSVGSIPTDAPQRFQSMSGRQIGPPLFYRILDQLGIGEKEFEQLGVVGLQQN
jgi:hypothetical protein